jgi:hypothetical protein
MTPDAEPASLHCASAGRNRAGSVQATPHSGHGLRRRGSPRSSVPVSLSLLVEDQLRLPRRFVKIPKAAPDTAALGMEIAASPQLSAPNAAASPANAPIKEKSNHRGKFIFGPDVESQKRRHRREQAPPVACATSGIRHATPMPSPFRRARLNGASRETADPCSAEEPHKRPESSPRATFLVLDFRAV